MAGINEIELVEVKGTQMNELKPAPELIDLLVTYPLNKLPRATIILKELKSKDLKYVIAGSKQIKVGGVLALRVKSPKGSPQVFFTGVIERKTVSENLSGVRVQLDLCHAAIRMTKQLMSRVFPVDTTDLKAVKEILSYWKTDKVEPKLIFTEPQFPVNLTVRNLVQYQSTDWDFLCWRAAVNGSVVAVSEKSINVIKPKLDTPKGIFNYEDGQILDFEIATDGSQFVEQTNATVLNIKEPVTKSVQKPNAKTKVKTGDQFSLAAEAGARLGTGNLEYMHAIPGQEKESKSFTDAQQLRADLSAIQGRIRVYGNQKLAALAPGDTLSLEGFGVLNNKEKVFVSGISHHYGQTSWTVDIQFGLSAEWYQEQRNLQPIPASGLIPSVSGLQLAEVIDTQKVPEADDAKILVKLLHQNSFKGNGEKKLEPNPFLARLSGFYAGIKYGAWFRPEKGDVVVLGFLNDDPRHPVILGSVYRNSEDIPLVTDAENKLKGLVLGEGMGVTFDTVGKLITITADVKLEPGKTQSIELDQQKKEIRIHHTDKHSITLSEKGINIITAGEFNVTSDKDINLVSTAKVNIKGAEINLDN